MNGEELVVQLRCLECYRWTFMKVNETESLLIFVCLSGFQ